MLTLSRWWGGVLTRGALRRARTPHPKTARPATGGGSATTRARAGALAESEARSHDGPERTRRLRRAEAREPRRLGPNTTKGMRRVAARYRPTRHATTTRYGADAALHTCAAVTRRPGRPASRAGAERTKRIGTAAKRSNRGPAAGSGRLRDKREQPAAGQVSDYIGSLERPTARQGH